MKSRKTKRPKPYDRKNAKQTQIPSKNRSNNDGDLSKVSEKIDKGRITRSKSRAMGQLTEDTKETKPCDEEKFQVDHQSIASKSNENVVESGAVSQVKWNYYY